MSMRRWPWLSFARALVLLLPACNDGDWADICAGGECICRDVNACTFDCRDPGCHVRCQNSSSCGGRCSDACAFTCHDASSCNLLCGNDCTMTCGRTSLCAVDCLDGCRVTCSDVSSCRVTLKSGWVVCERTGGCDVTCVVPGGTPVRAQDCGSGRFACGPC